MDNQHSSNGIDSENVQKVIGAHDQIRSELPKHRPLTPARVLRGLLCLVIYISSAFTILVCWAPLATLAVRLVSIQYSRKLTSIIFGAWLALWPFLFEKINKTKVIFSGDIVPEKERVLVFANHRTEVDWMYLWNLALRKHCLGSIKYILKSSLMKLPIFGWGFHILEFISVERKWEIDEPIIRKMLSTFHNPREHLWLVLFPEGTDFNEQKCTRSQKFAIEHGLPILKNVLLPKTKGFCACVEALRNSLDAVYDITIAYKQHYPHFMDNVFGTDPSEVHMHVKRIKVEDIPVPEDEAASWLMERFRVKDELLSDFAIHGVLPEQGTEGDLSMLKCSLNALAVVTFTCICTYLTFFSTAWFKIYVSLSCAYLGSITYFNVRPSPILGCILEIFSGKRSNAKML